MAEPRSNWLRATCAVLAIASVAGVLVLFSRQHAALASEAESLQKDLAAGPVVRVARVAVAEATRTVTMQAEVRAERRSTVYAKVSGYVKRLAVERGDTVKKGQVLAELESPDLDEQVAAAQAEVTLRERQRARAQTLSAAGRVSQQEREQADEQLAVAKATLARTRAAKGYQLLRAPFDGTVTARYVDAGALLPAATGSTTSAQPLVDIAQIDRLRVALHLAQDDASRVRAGDAVTLQISPDEAPLQARISRISRALDPRTRTMLCEIDLPHPPEGLYPGAFVQVVLPMRGKQHPLVPAEALVSQGGQPMVAVVDGGKIHFQRVKPGGHDGASIEILDGLRGGELVALNLGPEVQDGAPVRAQDPARAGPLK